MTIRVGINGFGRIGRTILRAVFNNKDIQVVHINDLTNADTLAHLLRYDSIHGKFGETVTTADGAIEINGKKIAISSIRNPAEIPWRQQNVDIVFECTGLFTKRSDCELHLKAGAPKVLISAPGVDEDFTVVYGVNSDQLLPKHTIVSNGSCTTNCLAPVVKTIHESFGIIAGTMTTVHAYTNDQKILDLPHKDLRRARAASMNIIPTSTGAARAIGLVIPALAGKIDGLAVRVPTSNVSVVDMTLQLEKICTVADINNVLCYKSSGDLANVMGYTDEPLVSSDYNGDTRSSIIDGLSTQVVGSHLAKVLSWYDNETGFSNRMLDIARLMVA